MAASASDGGTGGGGRARPGLIVRPTDVCFITVEPALVAAEPRLPPLDGFSSCATWLLLQDRAWQLGEPGAGPADGTFGVRLFGVELPVLEAGSLHDLEEGWRQRHAPELEAERGRWLAAVTPELVDPHSAPATTPRAALLARAALDHLAAASAATSSAMALPRVLTELPAEAAPPPCSTLRAACPGYDGSLFVDSVRHDLLSPRELFRRFERGFDPALAKTVLKRAEPWGARELSSYLAGQPGSANPKSLSAVRNRLSSRADPPVFRFGGRELVPDPQAPEADFMEDWRRALSVALRREWLEACRP